MVIAMMYNMRFRKATEFRGFVRDVLWISIWFKMIGVEVHS